MNHVLTTGQGTRFLLSEKEKQAVYQAVANQEKMVIVQGQMISLQIVPEVIAFANWLGQENDRLANQNKERCPHCLTVKKYGDRCACRDGKEGGNPFSLPAAELQLRLTQPKNGNI